jgi:hypothetical protein
MKSNGSLAFLAGFLLAAIPLSYWLLTLEYGENGLKVSIAVIAEFSVGFVARALWLKLGSKTNKATK